tara:strand:+ start:904 stop:1809 length:906 start_codon:yes stop_codon:yes gene_type:complete
MRLLIIVLFILLIIYLIKTRFKKVNSNTKGKIIIASLTHKPIDFDRWLNHHFKIGVDKIYLRVEETPELQQKINRHPRRNDIIAEYHQNVNKTNNWHTLQDRQREFVTKVIKGNQDAAWIFQNIDDDELLYPSCGNIHKCLSNVGNEYEAVFVKTIEGLFPKENTNQCFNTDKFVACDGRHLCTSYYGGKSGGRLTPQLRPHGPHQFQGNGWKGQGAQQCHKISDKELVVLHFESCSFDRWKSKYENMNPDSKKIPKGFKFYNDSVEIVSKGNENEMHQYYKSKKVDPYYKVEKDFRTIKI